MKRLVFWQLFVAALLLTGNSHAQSIKDLFNKENIEKAVNAVTGKSTADMTGTWSYTGSAIEFESDNLLQKAGGAVATTAAEKKPVSYTHLDVYKRQLQRKSPTTRGRHTVDFNSLVIVARREYQVRVERRLFVEEEQVASRKGQLCRCV